jgi:cyanophycinase
MGFILLEGGAEFGGQMEFPDRQAISMAGGSDVPISIIPAAAAPDKNHLRAGKNAVGWFQSLGATNVTALPVVDRLSADDPDHAVFLKKSKLIYLLGGFPRYLGQTLASTRCWQAIQAAYRTGAVIAGSSAGAMVLCENYYDPVGTQVMKGLGLIGGICVLPHHNTFGRDWAPPLQQLLPDTILVGIDEETGIINDASADHWQVFGKGASTVYRVGQIEQYISQQAFVLHKG